jgi:hypothetical protein
LKEFIDAANQLMWGSLLIWLLLGAGLLFTVMSGFIQVRHFAHTFGVMKRSFRREHGGISSFEAYCTSLGARVGTGNLAGVAVALELGAGDVIEHARERDALGLGERGEVIEDLGPIGDGAAVLSFPHAQRTGDRRRRFRGIGNAARGSRRACTSCNEDPWSPRTVGRTRPPSTSDRSIRAAIFSW